MIASVDLSLKRSIAWLCVVLVIYFVLNFVYSFLFTPKSHEGDFNGSTFIKVSALIFYKPQHGSHISASAKAPTFVSYDNEIGKKD